MSPTVLKILRSKVATNLDGFLRQKTWWNCTLQGIHFPELEMSDINYLRGDFEATFFKVLLYMVLGALVSRLAARYTIEKCGTKLTKTNRAFWCGPLSEDIKTDVHKQIQWNEMLSTTNSDFISSVLLIIFCTIILIYLAEVLPFQILLESVTLNCHCQNIFITQCCKLNNIFRV